LSRADTDHSSRAHHPADSTRCAQTYAAAFAHILDFEIAISSQKRASLPAAANAAIPSGSSYTVQITDSGGASIHYH